MDDELIRVFSFSLSRSKSRYPRTSAMGQAHRLHVDLRQFAKRVNLARGAFSPIAPYTVYVQVMHKREEPGAEIRTALPAMLLCNGADEGVLDEVVSPGHVVGQGTSIAPRGISFSKSRPKSFILPSNVLGKLPAGYGA
jgi:hypothetical protein